MWNTEAFCADLIEHVLKTEGDAYLKTLEDELSFVVRNSIDTHALVGALVALVLLCSWKLSQVFVRSVVGSPGTPRNTLLALLFEQKQKKSV